MSKHTPGPWVAHKSKTILGGTVYNVSQQDGAPYTPNYSDVCQTVEGELEEIQLANANLIAAAPELLEALYEALPFVNDDDGAYKNGYAKKVERRILAAISKAEGKL